MERHHEKRRDIARSILPSKNRKPARQALAHTKRAHRYAIRQELHGLPDAASGDCDDWDDSVDLAFYPDAEIGVVVRRRRAGDKVNNLVRWAIAITADVPPAERISKLAGLLDDGVVGHHAVTHLEWEPLLKPVEVQDVWRRRWLFGAESLEQQRHAIEHDLEVVAAVLYDTVSAPGGLASLNRAMKTCDLHASRAGCDGCRRRCLAGVHDIEDFVADVHSSRNLMFPARSGPAGLPGRALHRWMEYLNAAVN